ncbi:MAG TPA: site-specific integrase [Polyangiaceae bacterium]|nr:site-specific integrase [Polyangiaceae bacterium]
MCANTSKSLKSSAALFRNDATSKRLRFHDLRGTGLTWMAIRGDDPLKIQQRAGHTTFDMTQKYIRTAEAEAIGDVFPPLPACLQSAKGQLNCPKDPQVIDIVVEAPGIETGAWAHAAVSAAASHRSQNSVCSARRHGVARVAEYCALGKLEDNSNGR